MSDSCLVCSAPVGSRHFGAWSCRACAAFFRRCIVLDIHYKCHANDTCRSSRLRRPVCRHCRFKRCLEAGMLPSEIGPTQEAPAVQLLQMARWPHIRRLLRWYEGLKKARLKAHGKAEAECRSMTYEEMCAVHRTDIGVLIAHSPYGLDVYPKLDESQQKLLFRNFLIPFGIFEVAYWTSLVKKPKGMVQHNGNYIDFSNLETYSKAKQPSKTSLEIFRLASPYHDIMMNSLVRPIGKLNLDEVELLLVFAVLFWASGVEGEAVETEEIAKEARQEILREASEYVQRKGGEGIDIHLANLLLLIPVSQRIATAIENNFIIAKIFNLHHVDERLQVLNIQPESRNSPI